MAVAPVEGEEAPRPMSRMRRTIAARLTNSWQTTPHFTVTVAVDVTRVLALRAELKAEGHSLTVTDFVLAATAQTLAEFPDVNSRTDGEVVYPRRRVHLGVAVSVPSGLVVPVVRDADRITIVALHDRVAALAAAAREGTIAVDDLTGSTFTVSNLGMFGVEEFSAIINPGEAAILAVSSAVATPVAIDGGHRHPADHEAHALGRPPDRRRRDGSPLPERPPAPPRGRARVPRRGRERLSHTHPVRRDLLRVGPGGSARRCAGGPSQELAASPRRSRRLRPGSPGPGDSAPGDSARVHLAGFDAELAGDSVRFGIELLASHRRLTPSRFAGRLVRTPARSHPGELGAVTRRWLGRE